MHSSLQNPRRPRNTKFSSRAQSESNVFPQYRKCLTRLPKCLENNYRVKLWLKARKHVWSLRLLNFWISFLDFQRTDRKLEKNAVITGEKIQIAGDDSTEHDLSRWSLTGLRVLNLTLNHALTLHTHARWFYHIAWRAWSSPRIRAWNHPKSSLSLFLSFREQP